jgi:hypothetical protein
VAFAAEEISEGRRILVFEKSISLKYGTLRMEWAPDNRRLAVIAMKGYTDPPNLQVIDTGDDKAADRVILKGVGHDGSIAWSPDGQTIAVHHHTGAFYGIQLVSVINAREVAQRSGYDGCLSAANPMAFAHDGGALWVTCRFSVRALETFPVAIKYRVPDLVSDDRLVLQSPVAGARAGTFAYSLASINDRLRLSVVIGYDAPGTRRHFAYGFDLGRKTELFPHFETVDDNRSELRRYPAELILSPDTTYGLVRLSTGTFRHSGMSTDKTLDRLFDGYDIRTSQRVVTFGGMSEKVPEAGVVGQTASLRDGETIVGRWSRAATSEGGLVVMNARTGAVHQRIRFGQNTLLALSPDGTRLAILTYQNEIRLYRVGRLND